MQQVRPTPHDPPPAPAEPAAWEATAFVAGVWGFLLAVAFVFVFTYAADVPSIDDWAVVPYVTGGQPVTLAYLWEQHNEHRIPLPKLLLVFLLGATGDFRVGPYLHVLLLAGLALAMLGVMRRLRGRLSYTDAFFPLLLLSIGHYENILWTWQIQFVLSSVLVGALFLLLAAHPDRVPARRGWWLGAVLVLLPLCGGQGLPYAVLVGGWLAWVGVRRGAAPGPHRAAGWGTAALALASLALVGLYYVDYRDNPGEYSADLDPTFLGMIQTTLELWGMSLGAGVQHKGAPNFTWPLSCVVAGGVVLGSLGGLAVRWHRTPRERERLGGLLAFLLAVVGLSLAMGYTRAGGEGHWEGYGSKPRYTTLMMPLMYQAYFATTLLRSGRRRGLAQMALFTLVCAMSVQNMAGAVEFGKRWASAAQAFADDLAQGEPAYVLARRHARPLGFEVDQQRFADDLRLLRRAGFAPYRDMKDDPPFREVPVPVQPADVAGMTWDEARGQVTDPGAYLTLALTEPRFVSGIRITVAYPDQGEAAAAGSAPPARPGDPAGGLPPPWVRKGEIVRGLVPRLQVAWKTPDQSDFVDVDWWAADEPRWDEARFLAPGPQEQTVTIWVADTIDQFRIFPDRPIPRPGHPRGQLARAQHGSYAFTITAITLLVPEAD